MVSGQPSQQTGFRSMSRQLVLGMVAAFALGAATLAPTTATQAQSWSLSIGTGGYHDGYGHQPRRHHDGWGRSHWSGFGGGHRGWRSRHGHGYGYGDGYGYHQPRCHVRSVRYWDGWSWVVDRRRVCH
jgi:opacity protein-like surface antigen